MELYDEQEINNPKSKLPMIIGICIGILTIITIALIVGIFYLKGSITTISIDGVKNTEIEKILYIQESENGAELYIPIKQIASYLNYEGFTGDYKNKSEDKTKCHVKNEYETSMFTLNSDTIIKTRGEADYEYLKLDKPVLEKDGELYTTVDGIEKGFNVDIAIAENMKEIDIFTMDYLVQYFATKLKIEKYSEAFTDKKAIFEDMIIIEDENQYGVVQASTGKMVLETKYEEIRYLPITTDFIVKSNNLYGVVAKDTSIKVKTAYQDIKVMDNQKGLYLVKQNNLYGVIDTEGKEVIETEYKQIGIDNISKYAQNGVENQYVLLDEIIPIKNSQNLWGFFNTNGEKIKDFEYTGVGCSVAQTTNSYPALVIPSEKIIVVEKDKKYNLITIKGEELIPSYVVDSIYLKSNTETGENTFYMTNNTKVLSIEEWITNIER